jgi:MFS family permease
MTQQVLTVGVALPKAKAPEAEQKAPATTPEQGRWLTIAILSMLQLTENSEGGLVNTVFPIIQASLGIGLAALGVLTSVGKFARMIMGPVWAMLSDRFGRKLILVVSALWAVWTVAAGFAQTYNQLLILYGIGVLGTVAAEPISNGMVGDLFRAHERGKVYGTMRSITGLGSIVITPLLGQLAGIPNNNGWRYGMFIMGGITIVAGLLTWAVVKEPQVAVDGGPKKAGEGFRVADVPKLLGIPTVALLGVQLIFITSLVLFAFQVVYLVQVRKYVTQQATLLVAVFFIGFTISSFMGGIIGDWFSKKNPRTGRVMMMQLYLVAFAVMSYLAMQVNWPKTVTVAGMGLADTVVWFVFGLVASLGFSGCVLPMVSTVVLPQYRSTAFALLFSFIQGFLAAIFSLFLGGLAQKYGLRPVMFWMITVPYAINTVFWFVFYKTYPKDQERMRRQLAAQSAGATGAG